MGRVDGSVKGTLRPKTRILMGVDDSFNFSSFTNRKNSLCRCISMEVCSLKTSTKFVHTELEIVAAPRHEVPSRFGDQQ